MTRKNIEAIYPLSPMQQGLLFHTLYAPQSGVYFVQNCYTLCGDLNVSVFRRAWQYVLERHPILRTIFIWENREKPLQIVYRQVNLSLEQHDWRSLSLAVQQERLESFLAVDRERGFALSKTPPLRLALIQVGKAAYQFILSFHHLLLDGWSVSLLLKEVFACYEAYRRDQQLLLEPSRPYQDYIVWLRQQDLCEAEVFWRQALKDFSAPTPLRVDRGPSSPPGHRDGCGEQGIKLSAATTAALRSFAQHYHLTLNTLIQGAWAVLLSCYSGEEDVVFGTTVSGRPAVLADVESMVGLFINTLPVRVQASGDYSLTSWLKSLQDQQVELRQYEYSPLVQVQKWSEVPQGIPLFESTLLFQNYPLADPCHEQCKSLEVRTVRTIERTHYPLTVVAVPGRELLLRILYQHPRFDAATVVRMLGHLRTLLENLGATSQQRLSDLVLLTAAERRQLLVEWNDTQTEYPKDSCLHELFEAQVERTPDAVAVVCENQRLTYRELNRRANQLAHHLCALGVGPEVPVGICMERSLEIVVGLLGILKAGGAYVPLDPAYPQERLAFMLEDAQASVLVTQQQLIGQLPKHGAQLVCLDAGWEAIAQEDEENVVSGTTADNLAYVIYTSGSTGTPKGVAVPHQAVNRLVCHTNYIQVESSDKVAQAASASFDAATFEIWGALLHGAQLIELPQDLILSPQDFAVQLREQEISILFLTTALFNQLAREASWAFRAVRHLLFGGEAVDPRWVKEVLNNGPPKRLLHVYGPTESTTFASWHLVQEVPEGATTIPIGRPIANTQIYLLDNSLQPVPVGVPGELYIGGDGLARGYLHRPELTAAKFIPNPFSAEPGARLYKTGDLARYRPDGNIEFLGRTDHQVKIRGFRIELWEIEAVLSQHPAVRESVVLAREDQPDNKRLVAYVVANQSPALSIRELRSFLKQKLPEYMVPSAFVLLDALPLTPNGKVDHRALLVPDHMSSELERAFVAPRIPVEEMVAGIWAEVLGLKRVGMHDNFFELGGHSLLATQIISRVRNTFHVELSLRTLFDKPTVEAFAEAITLSQTKGTR